MVKVGEILASLDPSERWFSCEYFPPKTAQGVKNLVERARRLTRLGARFVSVTWGAGGSSAGESLALAEKFAQELNVPVVLHLTCTNMSRKVLDETLATIAAPDSGIDNILALRGDRPRNDYEQSQTNADFAWAADLVRYIHKQYPGRFSVGVAAYPEGFTDSPTRPQNIDSDLKYLDEKVRAGADFVITQLFYDAEQFLNFQTRMRKYSDALAKVPLVPGIMPVTSYNALRRSAELSHASLPPSMKEQLASLDTQDDEQVKAYGVKLLTSTIKTLETEGHVNGFHFFTLNLEKSLSQIVQLTGLVTKSAAASVVEETSQSKAATWDDFTNGRYTDPDSAAFGQIDGYGPVVHGAEDGEPHPGWAPLESDGDVSKLFVRHITNEINVTPFSDQPLSAETALIQEELIELNSGSELWTLASQPAAFDVKSTDRMLGWGPAGGKVSQHAFVELLMTPEAWKKLQPKLAAAKNIIYYAGAQPKDSDKDNVVSNVAPEVRNAVTWGYWKDNQKVEATIICQDSFVAWRDEVFSVLKNWQHLYPAKSAAYKVLGQAADTRWLVTVIYTSDDDEQGLWKILL